MKEGSYVFSWKTKFTCNDISLFLVSDDGLLFTLPNKKKKINKVL